MSGENFHLQWQEFEANTASAFKSLLGDQDLLDVTLVSEDQLVMEAHRVVLFTSSTFFKRVLRKSLKKMTFLMDFSHSEKSYDVK